MPVRKHNYFNDLCGTLKKKYYSKIKDVAYADCYLSVRLKWAGL